MNKLRLYLISIINFLFGYKEIDRFEASSKEIDSKVYRKLMHQYFYSNKWSYEDRITKVEAREELEGLVIIEVETHMPGVFIGKGGSFINGLTDFINEELRGEHEVQIHVKECKMWNNIYR